MFSDSLRRELGLCCRGLLLFDEPLRERTWFGIGGPSDAFAAPVDADDLHRICGFAVSRGLRYFILGGGSNILFSDAGFRGIVIWTGKGFTRIEFQEGMGTAGAGVNLVTFSKRCAERGAAGMEYACGIPGSVGGAVKGNAGAFGVNTGERLLWLDAMTADTGAITRRTRAEIPFGYRFSGIADDCIILSACFSLGEGRPGDIEETMRGYARRKAASQPLSDQSAGCIFKNPEGRAAGRLLEEAGCKGMRIGGACVSERHANFIVNLGNASAADVLALVHLARSRVKDMHGIDLEVEVRVINETGEEQL